MEVHGRRRNNNSHAFVFRYVLNSKAFNETCVCTLLLDAVQLIFMAGLTDIDILSLKTRQSDTSQSNK